MRFSDAFGGPADLFLIFVWRCKTQKPKGGPLASGIPMRFWLQKCGLMQLQFVVSCHLRV